jgi:cell division protein FtsW (lipid II flippase)
MIKAIMKLLYQHPINGGSDCFAIVFVTWCAIIGIVAIAVALGSAALYYSPNNHCSLDVRWLALVVPFGLAWLVIVRTYRLVPRSMVVALACSILLLAVTILIVDRFNLLVDYDVWTTRGMPERWKLQ